MKREVQEQIDKTIEMTDSFDIIDDMPEIAKRFNKNNNPLKIKIYNSINKLAPKQGFDIPIGVFEEIKYPETLVRNIVSKLQETLKNQKIESDYSVKLIKSFEGKSIKIQVRRNV